MSGPVDVLAHAGGVMAVMNRMVGQSLAYRSKSGGHSDKERDDEYVEDCEARAAVAELIETLAMVDRIWSGDQTANIDPESPLAKVRAALTKVGAR